MIVQWKNRALHNWEEALQAALLVAPHEVEAFLEAFRLAGCEPDTALNNIGYWTGYYAYEDANEMLQKLRTVFGPKLRHPIFGDQLPADPAEALMIGMALGEAAKVDKKDRS